MPKCVDFLPCDWLICNLCYQAIEQVYLIKWLVSVDFKWDSGLQHNHLLAQLLVHVASHAKVMSLILKGHSYL